jgi:hypothetical protein
VCTHLFFDDDVEAKQRRVGNAKDYDKSGDLGKDFLEGFEDCSFEVLRAERFKDEVKVLR